MSESMSKWAVDVISGDPFEGATMYFYAEDAELLCIVTAIRVDNVEITVSDTLEVTANKAKFNFGIKMDDGHFTNLRKV